ncbi:accessory gene regulator ArgB-like protein [Lacrimispora aerotolerans]|jgi:accessory gene regulator B|uniref:accessory gene regulator ArgB-like protein n=1 Tax=Lacrimispora aerotolerans TaxID=36832 RepID=UPI00047DAE99|nr:accessory gene regulator B family protein [Lacrimispora aerotolerans]
MIQRLSDNIVCWQIRKNIIENEQRALYCYAYEVFINQTINILIAIFISIVLKAPMPVLVFFLSYLPLRSYCGGYHSKTNGGCTIVSSLLIVFVCLVEKTLTGELAVLLPPICLIISGASIFNYAPVADKNKPLDEVETRHYRKKSRTIWLLEAIIGAVFWYFGLRAGVVIATSHAILSFMLVYGVFKNKKACD